MSGDENDDNIACDLRLSLRYGFSLICFMILISSRASRHLNCDFMIGLGLRCLQNQKVFCSSGTLPEKIGRCHFSLLTEKTAALLNSAAVPTSNRWKESFLSETTCLYPEVGIPQFEAQSASCATSARAEVAKRFNKVFLAIAQVALRFKENKFFLRFVALRTVGS